MARDSGAARRFDGGGGSTTDSKARIMRPPNHSFGRGRDKARATAGIQPGRGQVSGGETKSESGR